jgi:hypothetical protein
MGWGWPFLFMDRALVTSEGIKYRDRLYSSSAALRRQWFEQALKAVEWEVEVHSEIPEENLIHIICPETEEIVECRLVMRREADNEIRDSYYAAIQRLKEEKALLKANKRKIHSINF